MHFAEYAFEWGVLYKASNYTKITFRILAVNDSMI